MATSYTAKLHDGPQEFKEFVLSCARAFTPLIEMRDEPFDAAIPPEFKPSPYYWEQIVKRRVSLKKLEAMPPSEAAREAERVYTHAMDDYRRANAKTSAVETRYRAMLTEVQSWVPPTPEHQELKDYMVQQLAQSLDHDCYLLTKPNPVTGAQWLEQQVEMEKHSLSHYERAWEEEQARVKWRNEWVSALRKSLSGADR